MMNSTISRLCLVAIGFVFFGTCNAQILTFNFAGTNPGQSSPWTTTSALDANLTLTTGWSLGAGLAGNSGNNRYNASNWSTGASFSVASSGNDYAYFQITAKSGYALDLRGATITFSLQNSGTGPDFYSVRSSVDSYASDLSSASTALNAAGGTTSTSLTLSNSITLSAITDTVQFRVYGWGASATSGTMSINSWSMTGSVASAIPEPSTYAAMAGVAALLGVMLHRRRRQQAVSA